jgi:hypothetical protein
MNNNKGILIIIAIALLGILGVMLVNGNFGNDESIGGSVNEVVEEVQDEIDDNTTAR